MRLSAAFLLVFALAAFAAAPPAGAPAEWLRWIEDLGDEDKRDAAMKKIEARGEDVLPLLRRVEKKHDDPDVRLRAVVAAAAIERKVYGEVRRFVGHTEGVIAFALSPDGRRMVSAAGNLGRDHTPRVWEVETGKELFRLRGHEKAVYAVAWSADGKRILTGGLDGKLILHDAATGKATRTITSPEPINSLALAPDTKRAVGCGDRRVVRVWDLTTGKQVAANEDATQGVRGVAMMPDGKRFVSASYDGAVRLIEVETGKLVREMEGGHHPGSAWSASVSPDGKRIVSTGGNSPVWLWDAGTGKRIREFKGHTENVAAAAFSRDGRRLITAGYDKVARVWDVRTGNQLQCLEGHDNLVTCAAFLPDGRAITASHDKTLRLWRLRK